MTDKKKAWEYPRELRDTMEESPSSRKGNRETALAHRDTVLNQQIKLPALADLFRVAWSTINDGVIVCDPDGIVTSVNPAAQTMTAWTENEACGKPLEVVFPVSNDPHLGQGRVGAGGRQENRASRVEDRCSILDDLSFEDDESGGSPHPKMLVAKDGSRRPVETTIKPIKDDQGKITGLVLAFRDADYRRSQARLRQSEEQLRQSQKMEAIGQLAGGIAHDFNNLLTIITGYSEMLLNRLPMEDPSRELIREIHKSGDRAAALTRQLLAFSRKQVLAPVVLDLNEVVQEMEKMLRRLIGEDIELATILDSKLDLVKADPGQIEQVIMNLAVNARDAMPVGGKLIIETANVDLEDLYLETRSEVPPGSYVTLSVSDTGCGMDERTKARIFEPFFTTKGPGKGTGLGLATVYGIVKQSGGYIFVDSEVGNGTTFKLFLPPVAEEKRKPRTSSFKAPRGNETLLLVEDEHAVRTFARDALQSYGYHVLEAAQGMQALQIAELHKGTIHLLVTDVVMPQLGGRQLVDKLHVLQPRMKVLYLSGYTDDAVVRHGLLAGETAFLQKPFTPVILAHKVREVLDQ
jgi:two-component system, cell cycle sensor histidine kinase and response regulator CckA